MFSVWNQPDSAAEILIRFRDRLRFLDIDRGLDLLAAQIQGEGSWPLTYRDYIAGFERDETSLFPKIKGPPPRPGLWQRLRAAHRALSDWQYIADGDVIGQSDWSWTAESLAAANRGDTSAQLALGLAHVQGDGVARDLVQARKWFGVAAANAAAEGARRSFAASRDALAEQMTPEQIAESNALATTWKRDDGVPS
jgi:hypothetical protein